MASVDPASGALHAASLHALRTALDAQKSQGQALVDLIAQAQPLQSGAPSRGAVAATPSPDEPGQRLDVVA